MALVNAALTTFNVSNYEGDLYNITPEDTPLLSAIGGLFGGELVNTTIWSWQEHDLRDADQRAAKEGQDAPTGTGRSRANVKNVLQIIHETVDVSYTKQAAFGQVADIGSSHPNVVSAGQGNPVMDELGFQIDVRLKEIARDVEFSLINGTFVEPADNTTERKTKGLLEAATTNATDKATIATNVTGEDADDLIDATAHPFTLNDKVQFTALTGGSNLELNRTYYVIAVLANTFQLSDSLGGTAVSFGSDITATSTIEKVEDLTDDDVLQLMQDVWDNGGIRESETAVIIANSWNKRKLTEQFLGVSNAGFRQSERNVGGVNLQTFDTDFGRINVMLNRYIPANQVAVASLGELRMKWLAGIPGGPLAVEQLGKVGAKYQAQFYGEFGLQFGNEKAHGVLSGLSTR